MENDHQEANDQTPGEITRRDFLRTVGAGAVEAAILGAATDDALAGSSTPAELVPLTLKVNGRSCSLEVEPRWTLLYVLRDKLGLTGTKPGCERGECGSCTVLIDDRPRYSCMTLALEADGREITTVEGLMDGEQLGVVQQAFLQEDGFQCGFCTPGQVMAAEGLLRGNSKPTMEEIRIGMSGNLCRCGAYDHIFKAVQRASPTRK